MSLLKVEGLTTRLASEAGWVHALDDLSLTLERGQTFALVGESGCGKSMTALSIARLLPDSGAILAGKVEFGEAEKTDFLRIAESAMRQFRGRRVSMIFQEPGTSLNPVMTVGDQITEVICLHQAVSKEEADKQALYWLERVGIPEPSKRLAQYPFELSGGQKQRVMIAMALACKPALLIADEPTTALDVSIQKQVLDLLVELQKQEGMAMLLITHDLGIVQNLADHVGLMYAGQLVESAPVGEFFSNPLHPYAHALIKSLPTLSQRGKRLYSLEGKVPSLTNLPIGCRFADRCEHKLDACVEANIAVSTVGAEVVHRVRCLRVGALTDGYADKSVTGLPSRLNTGAAEDSSQGGASEPAVSDQSNQKTELAQSGGLVLRTVGLSVAYSEKSGLLGRRWNGVLQDLDLNLIRGRTVALVGESGSGKTTAARALLGLLGGNARIDGEILYQDRPLSSLPERGQNGWRSKIQFVFQDPFASLNPRHRVYEILDESLSSLRPELSERERKDRLEAVVQKVKLPVEALSRFPHEFSGGQRQRIAIARALVSEPEILICDEPTSALDVSVQAQILNLLKQLQLDTGVAMLFITHNLAVVQYLADEVLVLKQGRVVERAATEQLFAKPKDPYTRELLNAAPIFGWS